MSPLSKTIIAFCTIHRHADGDDGGEYGYDYSPAACMEGDGDDDDSDYDYAPAAPMEGDDDDDGDYDYAPAA
jgi:hypothetical protein